MRHYVRHRGMQKSHSLSPSSGAECSWRTMGSPGCVVWVEPPWIWRSTVWPHLPAHHSPSIYQLESNKVSLWWIWESEALVQYVFQPTILFCIPTPIMKSASSASSLQLWFRSKACCPEIFARTGMTAQQGGCGTDVGCSMWPAGARAVGCRQP